MSFSVGNLGAFESFKEWSPLGDDWDQYFDGPSTEMTQTESDQMQLNMLRDAGGTEQEMSDARGVIASRPQASSGVNAGEVMQGIGAILQPLLQTGVGLYAMHQQKEQMEQMQKDQQRYAATARPHPSSYLPPPRRKSPVLMIVIGLAVVGVMGMMFYMMSQKGDAAPVAYAPAAAPVGQIFAPAPVAPQVRRVRRVRKRKKRRPR